MGEVDTIIPSINTGVGSVSWKLGVGWNRVRRQQIKFEDQPGGNVSWSITDEVLKLNFSISRVHDESSR